MPSAAPVGVVIANHNNDAFVEKAIESVARLRDERFRYVKLATNLGQAGELRRGLRGRS